MSQRAVGLEQIQRWMQTVIMHTGDLDEAIGSPQARAHVDVGPEQLEEVIRPSRQLSSERRLEIYVDAYYARLMECLDEEFAATRAALGEELFGAVTFGYLRSYPSESYTLHQLGKHFAGYLAQSQVHASAQPADAGVGWSDFIVELAVFERSLGEVFDGPGTETGERLTTSVIAEVPAERWPQLRFQAAPCLRLHAFAHPVQEYWAACKHELPLPAIQPRATWLAIHRRDYVVERQELSAAQFALLESLVSGAPLLAALRAAETCHDGEQPLHSQIGPWFADWTARGFFSALR